MLNGFLEFAPKSGQVEVKAKTRSTRIATVHVKLEAEIV